MKKKIVLLLPLLLIPLVSASCTIANISDCFISSLSDYFLSILNAPVQPLLNAVYNLLTTPVNIDTFSGVWGIIVYVLSLFYGILIIYTGFKLIISGDSFEKREKAKADLANILIMIVLVQASYFLYSLLNQLIASVTTIVFNMIDPNFFTLTLDNFANVGLEIVLLLPYLFTVLVTLILLTFRYVIVSAGVIFFAVGIFFYFFEPLKHYGKLIINFLIASMALTFFYSIFFLASSMLLNLQAFQNYKILVMIEAFTSINLATAIIGFFVIIKSASKAISPVVKVVSTVRGDQYV